MTTINTTKTFEEWLRTEAKETIEDVIMQKALYESNEENDYFASMEILIRKLKTEMFGDTITLAVDSYGITKSQKKSDVLIVTAIVMEPTENGSYRACMNPVDPTNIWTVSSIISSERFHIPLIKGNLFEAEYEVQRHFKHIDNLLKFKLETYNGVQEILVEQLNRRGNKLLARAATELFGTDVETAIVAKFLENYGIMEQKYETEYAQLTNQYEQLEMDEVRYKERLQQLNEKQLQWNRILDRIDRNMRLEDDSEEDVPLQVHKWEPEKAVEMLQSIIYHNSEDDLLYDEMTIEMFFRALQTNTLVILSGPSGTGKSTLVTEMANAIKGAKVKIVPIQSGWTDTQDLIGYFNPVDKSFVASPFMEALADASLDEEKEHLHLICLDEMNLAHIEHYFSEFLSIREQKKQYISLYNKRFYQQAKELIENSDDSLPRDQQLAALELIERFPYRFEIPKNVRFIGTLNMDHTVKSLSPKVIDRSFVIEIDHLDTKEKVKLENKVKQRNISGNIDVSVEQLSSVYTVENAFLNEALVLIELSRRLELISNAPLNSRGFKQLTKYLDFVPKKKLTKQFLERYYDQLIMTKILPRIELSIRDEQGMNILRGFHEEINKYPRSAKKLARMLENKRIVRFW
ncbi:AAA family ATPase [Paenibacillus sp. GYB006]|uniref:McrB family protein n=1 Tax=Paenibacillus sp. GYB006 TaxID=2994394 RepID=UPI002F96B11B